MATAFKEIIFFEKAVHGATPATIKGGGFAEYTITREITRKRSGEHPLPVAQDAVGFDIGVTIHLNDEDAYLTLLGNAESNLVLHFKTDGLVARKTTIKNVLFGGGGQSYRQRGQTQGQPSRMTGTVSGADTDTIATMIVHASDA